LELFSLCTLQFPNREQTEGNKEIYATTLDRIKGYSLDFERSSQEAYNKSLEVLEKEKLPELLNAILQ